VSSSKSLSPRFREYLGAQYAKKDLFVTLQNIKNQSYKAGIPVFAIYFLGYSLDSYQDVPVLLVNSTVTDRYTNEVLSKSEPFITSLFHEGMIVNVPALQGKKRDAIEKLLSIFDQSNRKENFHILNVNENDFAEEHRAIIRRLQAAIESKDMLAKMNAEDEAFSDIEAAEKERDAALQKAREAELRLDEAKSKLDVVESKLDVAESKLDAAESKLDEERRQKISLIKLAASGGASIAMIAKMCHISEAEVLAILEKD